MVTLGLGGGDAARSRAAISRRIWASAAPDGAWAERLSSEHDLGKTMSTYEARLAALREQLKADRLDGFVVPLTDEHMSEYVGSYAQRLAWLTGFQGSAGSAVVLPEEAAIFVDGRYTLQVRDQVDGKHWSYQSVPETSVADWLKEHAPRRRADRLRSLAAHRGLGEEGDGGAGKARGAELVAVEQQPDRQGLGRPARAVEGAADRPSRRSMPADRRPTSARRWPTG